MWMFAVLLILAAGMFPLAGGGGPGSQSKRPGRRRFCVCLGLVDCADRDLHARLAVAAALVRARWCWLGLWAYHFPKIGVAFMPALDEGTTLDMPITVPRASVTQSADDLKARDALLRGFPEVESVIGKAGRADTPTDPAPLDMVETFVNFRPKELWPKRVLKFTMPPTSRAASSCELWKSGGYRRNRLVMPTTATSDQRCHAEGPRAVRRDDARTGLAAVPGVRAGIRARR